MNNATHQKPVHPVSLSHHSAGEDSASPLSPVSDSEKSNLSKVLSRLNEINYTPRASTIRAIMRYSHEKDEALH